MCFNDQSSALGDLLNPLPPRPLPFGFLGGVKGWPLVLLPGGGVGVLGRSVRLGGVGGKLGLGRGWSMLLRSLRMARLQPVATKLAIVPQIFLSAAKSS